MAASPSTEADLCSHRRFWVFNLYIYQNLVQSQPQRLSTRHWKTSCGKSWRLNTLYCVFVAVSLAQFWSVSQSLKSTKANGSLLHTERQVEGWIGLQAVICQPLISANLPGAPGCLTFRSHYKPAKAFLPRLPLRPSYATET